MWRCRTYSPHLQGCLMATIFHVYMYMYNTPFCTIYMYMSITFTYQTYVYMYITVDGVMDVHVCKEPCMIIDSSMNLLEAEATCKLHVVATRMYVRQPSHTLLPSLTVKKHKSFFLSYMHEHREPQQSSLCSYSPSLSGPRNSAAAGIEPLRHPS